MLDVGCGVKFTQAIINEGLDIGGYVGIDVYKPLIDFLRDAVRDDRFSFHHVDFQNARYNASGQGRMDPAAQLPVEGQEFDLITGFSLFTHLEPEDAGAMLRMMRRCAAPTTQLQFTAFLDELSPSGHGLMDQYAARLGQGV